MPLPAPPTDNKFRIMVLEDDEEIARYLVKLLESAGFLVRHADDPDFVGWAEADPHLLVMEYQSTVIDAFAVCRQIRDGQTGAGTGIPILMIGPADDATEVSALKVGADDYLTRPLRPSVVMARVVTHLRRAFRYNEPAGKALASTAASPVPGGAPSPAVTTAQKAAKAPNGLPDAIGGIPLWQDEEKDPLPTGWAECTLCGQRGPSEEFETEDLFGNTKVECPNPRCRSDEHVMFSLD